MRSVVQSLAERVVGTVEAVSPARIEVLLDPEAPHATALNTGSPVGFPRINSYVLIPSEGGATVGVVSSVRIERLPYPKRKGMQDFGLVDLPFPARLMSLAPLGTLVAATSSGDLTFKVRRGVEVFPTVGDPVLLPSEEQLRAIVEGESAGTPGRIRLGHSPIADRAPIHVDPDKMFGRHLAILGNTGAGKSCSVAGLVRWSIESARQARSKATINGTLEEGDSIPNARFMVLDPNGEYSRAFRDLDIRVFRVEGGSEGRPLKVPAWLMNGEEWAAFTGAAPGVQRPILLNALRHLKAGASRPDEFETKVRHRVKLYGNRLRSVLVAGDHQGFPGREDLADRLTKAVEDFEQLRLDDRCAEKPLEQALAAVVDRASSVEESARSFIDKNLKQRHSDFSATDVEGVIGAIEMVEDLIKTPDHKICSDEDTPRPFAVEALPDFVASLASAQPGRDVSQFVDTLNLRIKNLLGRKRLASVLKPKDRTGLRLEDWLEDHIGADQAANGPIAVVDLSLVPSEFIHVVVSIMARMVFESVQRYRRQNGHELPTTLILEEAHTFIHRDLSRGGDSPAGRICCRTFERIAREGRKFGLGLVLASQRPAEISPTVLSQCNTFLLHRIVNDHDQELVKKLVPDGLGALLHELPSLPSQRAILVGWATPAPVLVQIRDLPENARPHSPDPAFWDVWVGKQERTIEWQEIARPWQRIGSVSEEKPG